MAKKKQSIEDLLDDIRVKIDELEDRINEIDQCDHDHDDDEDIDEDEDEDEDE